MDLEPQQPVTRAGVVRRHGCLRPRPIGCLLVVLVIAALWVLGRVVEGVETIFGDRQAPVAGSPFDTVAPSLPVSSGSPAIDRVTQRGRLIVAIQEAPGLAQRAPGSSNYTGFEIALLDLIARDLGVDPAATRFKPLTGNSRIAALERGEVDLALGGYESRLQPHAELSVAGPYLARPLRLAVPANSPITGLSSLGQAEVCTSAESPAAVALANRGQRLQTRTTLAACTALLGDRVAAIAGDQATLAALLAQAPGTLRLVDEPLGIAEYGIGLPPGDRVLHDRINTVLRNAINDGSWDRRYAEYLGTPVPSPPVLR